MAEKRRPFHLETCARPNILALKPYRCARDDYKDDGTNILLDANENAYGPGLSLTEEGCLKNGDVNGASRRPDIDFLGLNRYPDPHQGELKQLLCNLRNDPSISSAPLTPANLFVGVGSDEAIDSLLRAFCRPSHDKILTCPPTYGMYSVSAQVNDVAVVEVPTFPAQTYALDVPSIERAISADPTIKLIYLCSPGNPTGTLIPRDVVEKLLIHPTFNGIVVVDEAYIDFAPPGSSHAPLVTKYPNLVVMQTLSKAFGLAGIRLGAAFTSPPIARLLNNLKAPYNISNPTSELAIRALQPESLAVMHRNVAAIQVQRDRLIAELPKIPGVGQLRGGTDSNFLLYEFKSSPTGMPDSVTAKKIYEMLADRCGVVVRFRGMEYGCTGCLRITVGTEKEVDRFLEELRRVIPRVYEERDAGNVERSKTLKEEEGMRRANDVVA